MRHVRRRIILLSCAGMLAGGVLAGLWVKSLSTPPVPAFAGAPVSPSLILDLAPHIQAGDVIFRGRENSWGDLAARISDRDQRYGHVGVVVAGETGWDVIDAAGHPLARDAVVTRAPLNDFLYYSERAGLYRPTLSVDERNLYLAAILQHAENGTPFDGEFSLAAQDKVYCTELVWDGLKQATGRDTVEAHTQWRGKRVVAIDDLQYAPVLTQVLNVVARDVDSGHEKAGT